MGVLTSCRPRKEVLKGDLDDAIFAADFGEGHPSGFAPDELKIEGHTEEEIGYHVYIMTEAGLVEGANVTTNGDKSPQAIAIRLTWAGHEFAEAARDDSRWRRAMAMVKEKGGAITISILTELLTSLMKKGFGL